MYLTCLFICKHALFVYRKYIGRLLAIICRCLWNTFHLRLKGHQTMIGRYLNDVLVMYYRWEPMWDINGLTTGITYFLSMTSTDVPDDLSHSPITTSVRPASTPFSSQNVSVAHCLPCRWVMWLLLNKVCGLSRGWRDNSNKTNIAESVCLWAVFYL